MKKTADPVRPGTASPSDPRKIAFMGSSVVSVTACGVVIRTGPATHFGEIAARLAATGVETGFGPGVRRFAWLMIRAMACMVVSITGRFIESPCTQAPVIYVIRTARAPFIEGRPGGLLLTTSPAIVAAGMLIHLFPLAAPFGFVTPRRPSSSSWPFWSRAISTSCNWRRLGSYGGSDPGDRGRTDAVVASRR